MCSVHSGAPMIMINGAHIPRKVLRKLRCDFHVLDNSLLKIRMLCPSMLPGYPF